LWAVLRPLSLEAVAREPELFKPYREVARLPNALRDTTWNAEERAFR